MPTLMFNSAANDQARGAIDFDTDTFWVLLTTGLYVPDRDAHSRRSNVTNEVSGAGYTAGGQAVTVTVNQDNANDRLDVTLGGATWATATITARQAVYYKRRGGAASADELVCVVDFGADISSTGAAFTLAASTLRFTLP